MENETQREKNRRWEWVPFLLAMLLSFVCVFTATAMALMSQPQKLDDASMLPVGTADYGILDSEKTQFGRLDEAIFADATQDSAGLAMTPGNSGEMSGNHKTPIFIAFITPGPTQTQIPSPVVVTMDAPGTAVPERIDTATPTVTRRPTRGPSVTPTNTKIPNTATATPTVFIWPTVTSSATPVPTTVPSSTPQPPAPPPPTATPRPPSPPTATNIPPTSTPTATATLTPVPPTATDLPTNTPTATGVPPTATATDTPVPPTATVSPTPTMTATPETPDINVVNIALVNAVSDTIIPGYETMPDGITLDLTTLPTDELNMWVTLDTGFAHHVDVTLSGAMSRSHTEFFFPYTFPGNNGFDFHGWNFIPGSYTLTFVPYVTEIVSGTTFVFNFTVSDSVSTGVSPVLECVQDNGGGNYTAIFGYNNPNDYEINIPVGPDNRFTPAPENRGQPEYFHPGRTYGVITVGFTAGNPVTWTLDGSTATGGTGSPACP